MKTKSMLLASLAAFAIGATRAEAEVSVSLFYDALEPHGEWIEASDYGYVWTPRGVSEDWRPYTDGQWAYTDAGWTWVSEEPYGWATYHYGRWVQLDTVGWSWVPDTEWAPAWVSWRHSDRYVGWAPLPPESRETIRVGVNLGNWVDTYYDIGPTYYSFVEVRNLGAPRLRTVLVPPRENITIIQQTTNITNVVVRNNIVVNEGPQYDVIVKQTAQPIRRLKLNREMDIAADGRYQSDRYRTRIQGDSLNIAAPRFQAAAAGERFTPKKVVRKVENVSVNRGWKDAGDNEKVQAFRTKLQAEAKPPANLPPIARRDRGDRPDQPGADRPTARTGNEADTNTRPPGAATRDGRTTGDASRPGAGRPGAEDPSRPTADTTAPAEGGRPPGANRPGTARRMPAERNRPEAVAEKEPDSTQPPTGTTDRTRPGAPAATATPDPAKAGRPGAERDNAKDKEGKKGDRQNPGEAAMPKRETPPSPAGADASPATTGDSDKPARPDADSKRPGAPDRPSAAERRAPGATPAGSDRPGADQPGANRPGANQQPGANQPGADRPRADRPGASPAGENRPGAGQPGADRPRGNRPDAPDRPAAGAGGADRPEGARAGNPRADRPAEARGAGGEGNRPEGARAGAGADRPARQGAGAGEGQGGGAAQPGAAGAGEKPGKAPGQKDKKDGE